MRPRIAAAALLLVPAVADGASVGMVSRLAGARAGIASSCKLEAWQFALEPNAQDETRVELSPTLAQDQVVCVYQTLVNVGIKLDRPPPVSVTRKAVEAPTTIY